MTALIIAAWLLIGWLNARLFSSRLIEPTDGADFSFAIFLLICGPAGIPGVLMLLGIEGHLRLPGGPRVDWGAVTRRALVLKD